MFWRCLPISNKELQTNGEIRSREVRVVDKGDAQLSAVPIAWAMTKAAESNMGLMKVTPQAKPPVCRIVDYGKLRFEQAKRDEETRKNRHVVDTKEIRLSLNIDTHDFNTKVGHAARFLQDGDKVKMLIRFRDREMDHPEQRHQVMQKFAQACSEIANAEKLSKLEGHNILMFLVPEPTK